MRIAIPHHADEVAPCFEYTATMLVLTLEDGKVVDELDFPISSKDPMDRVRLLRDQDVGVVICGGVRERIADLLHARGVEVVAWVTGRVDELVAQYVDGTLVEGAGS